MITATKNSNTIISAAHHQYPGHPSMHGRTLSMVSSNGGDDIFASFGEGDEDGLSFDDLDAEGRDGLGPLDDSLGASHGAGAAGGANGAARKGKKLASTAEKKATHNAVERARRESLNTRFLVLADMLPGMNHVKRASKAAIVNKSIALIQDLQASEQKLTSENEALKAELAVLRQRVAAGPTPATPAAGAVPTASAPFPGMHAFAMHGIPMIPGMPPMMHHHPGMPVPPHPPSAPMSHEEAYRRASMEAAAAAAAAASAPPNMQMFQAGMQSYFGMPNLPLVDSPPSTSALVPAVKAESTGAGSPNSIYSQAAAASQAVQNVNAQHANLASELFPHGLFDFGMTGGSPAPSWTNGNSPPSGIGMHYTTAAAAASAELNKPGSSSAASSGGGPPGLSLGQSSAASPAGSQSSASTSITTPANTFSPIPLPSQQQQQHHHQQHFDACSGSSASGTPPPPPSSCVNANAIAAMAAFSENADPALLAAQFKPSELAKAQSELGAFIAYQQRMAGFAAAAAAAAATQQQQQAASYQNTAPQPTPSPTQSSFNLPTAQQQQQQQAIQQGNANSTANANAAALAAQAAAMGTMPAAWQMMLAQHHQQAQLAHQQQQQQQQHNSQAAAAAAMAAAAAAAGFQGQF